MRSLFIVALFLFPFCVLAQPGYIQLVAGNGTSGFSGDGGPATAARMGQALGVAVDASGNIYIPDDDNNRIRKVTPDGIITTIAGGGVSTTDGIPATNASLNLGTAVGGLVLDPSGNVVIIEGSRIRKIDVSTGIISTIAGTGTPGYTGDGGPATAARINSPGDIYVNAAGDLFIADALGHRIRKVSTTGIITTFAGTGTAGFSGDGGPATAAMLKRPAGIGGDAAGNIYISDQFNYRIRKIDPVGNIITIAGSGTSGFGGDGGPATAATVRFNEPSHLRADNLGNLYIADFHNSRVRKIDPAGIITTFAGGGSSTATAIPATSASFSDVWGIDVDPFNNVYIADRHHERIVTTGIIGAPVATADSFSVNISTTCSNTQFTISPITSSPGLTVKTYFGDGNMQTDACSYSGHAWFNHTYNFPGAYTVKHVLLNGSSAIDSVSYSYTYQFCRILPIKIFVDNDANCIYNNTIDGLCTLPFTFAVDSAGISIDTLPASSGLYYDAHGPVGTVYTFRPLDVPPGLNVTCPGTGIVIHTLSSLTSTPPAYLGFSCSSTPGHDLRLFTSFRAGVHHFGGTIVADNLYCTPPPATITMYLSPKYTNSLQFVPPPTSISGTTVTWDVSTLSSVLSAPFTIKADMEKTTGVLLPYGDTVNTQYTVTPITGDANTTNNIIIRNDTVVSGYDPNDIAVSPPGCLTAAQTKLTYTIRFENTGNATAYNIYVLDTLPAEVDVKSMRIEATSAVMNTYIKKTGGHNIVRFDFPDINLPDSAHGQNTGMVVYSINRKPSLADGTHIRNRCGIYFDDNAPVLTNTAENTIGCPIVSVNEVAQQARAEVHPNPATNELFITAPGNQYTTCTITNSIGQVLITETLSGTNTKLNISALPAGLYYVTLRGERTEVHKVVKM